MYKVFGIIGDPVSHTLSPVMHNSAFQTLGIKAVYGAFRVDSNELAKAIEGLKALNISGVSVTIPHKEEVVKYLDEVDPIVEEIGAVNTIINREGWLWGTNTDWLGVKRALEEKGIELFGKRVVILGAGGATRAIIFALKNLGVEEIVVFNRTFERAKALADQFKITAKPWSEVSKAEGDILIQATSVGLKEWRSPVEKDVISRFRLAMDIVYVPLKTKFLSLAEEAGLETIDGLRMLLYQGAEQFRLFTGNEPPLEIMEKVIYNEVKHLEKGFDLGDKINTAS